MKVKLSMQKWHPFTGCGYRCRYCDRFRRSRPRYHPGQLNQIPNASFISVCPDGDIVFCSPRYTKKVLEAARQEALHRKVWFTFQSKKPGYFRQFLGKLPEISILCTTLETNRDSGYGNISKAPPPSERYRQFKSLDWPHKMVLVTPMLDFDVEQFAEQLVALQPMTVYFAYNSYKNIELPEPPLMKVHELMDQLSKTNIENGFKSGEGQNLCQLSVFVEGKRQDYECHGEYAWDTECKTLATRACDQL